ncbi:hypothetical protein JGU66_28260 [Myxococcaceae bacterium JPH2]|nr:hypothetical protein [Myxococcaceae bacterium JPH2]
MKIRKHAVRGACALTAVVALVPAAALADDSGPKLTIGGTTYTKWLLGNMQEQGAMYNFTTVPGEGYGDNGIGTELELLLNAKVSPQVEVNGRIHSRFNQNFWTNFGGFGGDPSKPCVAGDCGEFDPRSNQYIKLRGMSVTLRPGYLVDTAVIGSNDLGQFDPFVIGRIRYIDRDNAQAVLLQGSAFERKLTWDAARIALPRLWAGPGFSTGLFHANDAVYGFQAKYTVNEMVDLGGIFDYANDQEVRTSDNNVDDGRSLTPRYRNGVGGLKAGVHVGSWMDVRAAFYTSYSNADPILSAANFNGISGYSAVIAGRHSDQTYMLNAALNDPLDMGLSLNLQLFSIGKNYTSVMASRREADVLLTEGHDGSFAFPGPSNASYGVFKGNPTRIGYGGWTSEGQQVATVNVDNDFTDFDEPFAESVIGWRGVTANPVYTHGALELSGEYSFITYGQNWQAYGDSSQPLNATQYPGAELDTGVGHNFRSIFQPFQDKRTNIVAVRAKYVLDVAKGIDLFGRFKYIHETDKRLNDPRFLPYQAGACAADGSGCDNSLVNDYSTGNSTSGLYSNPGVITNSQGQTGYQWKPFDNIADDDRVLDYTTFTAGAGYQFTDDLYVSASYSKFFADLLDGNTAFQAYNLHEMASGKHNKNQLLVRARYILSGVEFGLEGQYAFGTYKPDFGTGFVTQYADDTISADHHVKVGSAGFTNRFGGWNSMEEREFTQLRMKAFMKAQF